MAWLAPYKLPLEHLYNGKNCGKSLNQDKIPSFEKHLNLSQNCYWQQSICIICTKLQYSNKALTI